MTHEHPEPLPLYPRPRACVLLLDTHDRLLLFHETGGTQGEDPDFWFTPGGALEEGEDWEQAARRELWEETGLEPTTLGPWVWTRTHLFRWGDRMVESRERFYVVRTEPFKLAPGALEGWEERSVAAHRWWRLDEIEAARDEVFVPRRLAHHLAPLLAGELPAIPIDVGV